MGIAGFVDPKDAAEVRKIGTDSETQTSGPNIADDVITPDPTGNETTPAPTGGTTENYTGPGKDFNDADSSARFKGVGGHPEVWKNSSTGQMYLVYFAPGTEPPIPILYEASQDDLQAFFGEGEKIVYDKTMSAEEFKSIGAVKQGAVNALADSEGDPWLGFLDRMERLSEVSPWANDDQMIAVVAAAYLEDREVYEWEWETTDWWKEHTPEERDWLKLTMGDPAQAEQKIQTDQMMVRQLFDAIGGEADPALIEWMARQYTEGHWLDVELNAQIEAVTSGWGEVNEETQKFITEGGISVAPSRSSHETVRSLWAKWLGPGYPPTQAQIEEWATRIRKSGDGEEELISMLRGQRMALFPEYADPNLTFEDISGPWKAMAYNSWGIPIDPADPFLQDVIRTNNATEAQKMFRREGIDRGNDRVVNSLIEGMGSGMRSGVRGAV